DRGDAGEEDAEGAGGDRGRGDRPEAGEGDARGGPGWQRGRRASPGEGVAEGIGRSRGASQVEADRQRHQPPDAGDEQGGRVAVAVGDDRRDRGERRRLGAGEQDRDAEQVGVGHYSASSASRSSQPSGPATMRSASSSSSGGPSSEATPTQTVVANRPSSPSSRRRRQASRSVRSSPA